MEFQCLDSLECANQAQAPFGQFDSPVNLDDAGQYGSVRKVAMHIIEFFGYDEFIVCPPGRDIA
jgi:hypothetical protein